MTAAPATVSAQVRARRIAIGLVALCAMFTTSACAAGRHAATAKETPAVDAAGTVIGDMHLLGVSIKAPTGVSYKAGSDAELYFVVANTGQQTDTLTGITTSSAKVGAPSGAGAGSSVPAGGSSSPSGSTAASGSASARAFTPVDVPAGERRTFGLGTSPDYHLMLTGLAKELFGGNSVRITFTFARAGSTTLTVPVQLAPVTSAPVVTAGEEEGETPAE